MSNYPTSVGKPTIIEILNEEGLLLKIIENLEMVYGYSYIRMIVEGLANTSYAEAKFSRKLGDATRIPNKGYQIRIVRDLKAIDYHEYIDTLLHEVAHVIDFIIRGTSNHDSTWKSIAKTVGATPVKASSNRGISRAINRYTWVCGTAGCSFTHHFNRKKKYPIDRYSCPNCKGNLVEENREEA